ncbi:hypothetical protein Tco_0291797 [Tanacetum coccineum]
MMMIMMMMRVVYGGEWVVRGAAMGEAATVWLPEGKGSAWPEGVRDKNLIYGGMFVTRIARSFGLLTNEMRDALSIEPPPHIFKKKSLISIGFIIELQNGICVWPATPAVEEEDEAEEEARGDAGNEGAGSSADTYRNMSQGDWQVCQAQLMDQQDEH